MKLQLSIVVAAFTLLLVGHACAQCVGGVCVTWDDQRICRVDGATGCHVMVCGRPYILSCAHQDNSSFMQVGRTGTAQSHRGGTAQVQIVMTDERGDLSLWKLPDEIKSVKCFDIAATDPQPGEVFTLCGFPMMGPFSSHNIQVRGLATDNNRLGDYITSDRKSRPGHSGGPVINARDELSGVLWGAIDGWTCFCGTPRIRQFLAAAEAKLCGAVPLVPVEPVPNTTDDDVVITLPEAEADPKPFPKQEPQIDWEAWEKWRGDIDKKLGDLEQGKQDRGSYLDGDDLKSLLKQADDRYLRANAPIVTHAELNSAREVIQNSFDSRITVALGGIDDKLSGLGSAATVFGLPPAVVAVGSAFGPLGVVGAGLAYWRLSKRLRGRRSAPEPFRTAPATTPTTAEDYTAASPARGFAF